jgi:EcsC family protein
MARQPKITLVNRIREKLIGGFSSAYTTARVDPAKYLHRIQRAHHLPIESFQDMFFVPPEFLDDLADQTISAATKMAVLEGAGFGMGGLITIVPDMAILSAIVMRLLQKLSLIYGFEYSTDQEVATLWIAAASAAGVNLGRDILEKEAVGRVVPRVIERIAVKMSAEVAETWAGRIIPLVSGAIGGGLNYFLVRQWGRRAKKHFRAKHQMVRAMRLNVARPERTALPPSHIL